MLIYPVLEYKSVVPKRFLFRSIYLLIIQRRLSNRSSNPEKTKISWTPKFNVTGGYTNIVDNENYGHSSDLAIDLDLLKLKQDKRLSLNTYAGMLTLPDDLNPARVKYEIGPSLEINLDNFDLRIFHSYSCLYGLEDQGVLKDW